MAFREPPLPQSNNLMRALITAQKWRKPSALTSPFSSISRFIPDHPILSLLESARRHPNPIDLRSLHAHAITSSLIRHPFAASRILQFCLLPPPTGDPHLAAAIFHSLPNPDVYTYNAMIAGHIQHNLPASASSFYFLMRSLRSPPNPYTFALLVKASTLAGSGSGSAGLAHGQVLKCGVEDLVVIKNSLLRMYCGLGYLEDALYLFESSSCIDLISWNTLISGFGKNGRMETARELFDRMPQRSLVSWSALMDGYVRSGDFLGALRVFGDLQAEGVSPDVVALVSALKACAQLGALDQGRWIHVYVERNRVGMDGNVVLATALVGMYFKCGCIDEAMEVFDGVTSFDVPLWNAVISGLGMHGHGGRAVDLFRKMKERGMTPNGTTFIGVLCACSHAGMVDEGIGIFESMREHGVEPQREHYGCLADLLGRAGRLQEAEDVLLTMPVEPEASQWGALMSACRTHNDNQIGERVGKHLITLEPNDGGRYVLLSNMYVSAGKREEAKRIRQEMEEKGMRKETGCSFIEWNGIVHEFVAGGKVHPQSREIYVMLGEMEKKLEMVGYVKDTSQLLVDVDD